LSETTQAKSWKNLPIRKKARSVKRIFLIFACLMAASSLQAAPYKGEWVELYQGKWGPEHFFCYLPAHSSVISLEEKSLSPSESAYYCHFESVRQTGSKFTISMTCEGEVIKKHKDRMVLDLLGPNRMSVWRRSLGKRSARTFARCPTTLHEGERLRSLVDLWERTDAACRTMSDEEACEQRAFIHGWLNESTLCFGKEGDPEDQKRWHECKPGSLRAKSWRM
jgi:hypothetical protein